MASRRPERRSGYLPIRDYAAIGDGRTVALVGLDGSIDWLCLPNLDSPSAFGALLDAERGGSFRLSPEVPYEASRRYCGASNVLETTFETAVGVFRVTDALTLPRAGLAAARELIRKIEGLSGSVPVRWSVEPRFGYGRWATRLTRRRGVPVATSRADAVALSSWDAGEAELDDSSIGGSFETEEGSSSLLILSADHQEPLVFPARADAERRLGYTLEFWQRWADQRSYDGPFKEAVVRSALALKMLVYSPSGAMAAAPTTSLPESPGGGRNWDYRYSWIRDSSFAVDMLVELGCRTEADAFLWWMLHASQRTHPQLQVLYRLDGGDRAKEGELPLDGYGGAKPVRVGNGAVDQVQLDIYGDLFEAVWLYVQDGNELDSDTGKRLAQTANLVCELWKQKDAGIWEVRGRTEHFTHSKLMCWVALDRAARLAEEGQIPKDDAGHWREQTKAVRRFVDERCWSEEKGSYVWFEGTDDLDASILLAGVLGFQAEGGDRVRSTINAIRSELADGPLVRRYSGNDGLEGDEGAFLACSFWLASALADTDRVNEASELMEGLIPLANDVGLYSEEIHLRSGEFLGNFPQALTHLALIGAAVEISEADGK